MKRWVKNSIGISIFLLIMALCLMVLRPVYVSVSSLIRSYEEKALVFLAEKTGLEVRYKSLSPSILAEIHIRGVEVRDKTSGELIFFAKKVSVKYNLFQILKKNFNGAFSKVLINDVEFSFDKEKCPAVSECLQNRKKNSKKVKKEAKGYLVDEDLISLIGKVIEIIPFDVQARNLKASYSGKGNDFSAVVRSLSLQRQKNSVSVSTRMNGYASASLKSFKGKKAGFNFSLSGNLLYGVDGSSVILSIDENSSSDYTVKRMEYLLRYSKGMAVLRSTQRLRPYDIMAKVDLFNGTLESSLSMQSLSPLSLVKFPVDNKHLYSFLSTKYTADLAFNMNFLSKKYNWTGKGAFTLPEGYIKSKEDISFSAGGDNSTIYVESAGVRGAILSLDASASLDLKTKLPSLNANLLHYTLNNGNSISGTMYVRPRNNGIYASAPRINFGGNSLEGFFLELNRYQSTFSFNAGFEENSHVQTDGGAKFGARGTFSSENKKTRVNANVTLSSLFLDTAASYAAFFMSQSAAQGIESKLEKLSPYKADAELSFSTDLKGASFSVPKISLVNTLREDQYVLVSFEGNESSVKNMTVDAQYGSVFVEAAVDAFVSKAARQVDFSSALKVNSIPYNIKGIYSFDKWVNVTGDYGLEAMVDFSSSIFGSFQIQQFPVSFSKFMFLLSTFTQFSYSTAEGLLVSVEEFTAEETSGSLAVKPRINFSGQLDSKSAVLETLSYSDEYSSLAGNGYLVWNMSEGIFDSANLSVNLSGPQSSEKISLEGQFTNPLKTPLSGDHLKNDCYFTATADILAFPLYRIISGQNMKNFLSGTVSASGTLENPYISMNLKEFSMLAGGNNVHASGNINFMEGNVSIPSMSADWGPVKADAIQCEFNLHDFKGNAGTEINLEAAGKKLKIPLKLKVFSPQKEDEFSEDEAEQKKKLIPDDITLELSAEGISGNILKKYVPINLTVEKSLNGIKAFSDEILGLNAEYNSSGALSVSVDNNKPFHFNLNGNLKGKYLNLVLTNLYADLPNLASFVDTSLVSVHHGVLTGQAVVSGISSDPNIDGTISVSNLDVNVPMIANHHIVCPSLLVTMVQNRIEIPDTSFKIKDGELVAGASIALDRLRLDSLDVALLTGSSGIPLSVKLPIVTFEGRTSVDTHILYEENSFNMQGSVSLENSEITVLENIGEVGLSALSTSKEEKQTKKEQKKQKEAEDAAASLAEKLKLNVDLNLMIGKKVNFLINPLLRGLVAPNTPIHLTVDSANRMWAVEGDVALRGGEVFYFSRNFYLKEGRITLNENQNKFDPVLTIRAETRERDSNGETVTIVMEAQKQLLSQFSPKFTASPAKSENEIMEMLGQILTGDSSSAASFAVTAGDFVTQTLVLRKIEKGLRDFLNFDIFSVRTSLLQNAITQNMLQDSSKKVTLGNYFDNTTVYIGKYFGNDVYVDGLLRWSYDENEALLEDSANQGLVFQPELGLEFTAPFANIRWQFAPEMGELQKSWVPATSVTLSWRFTF